MKNIKIDFIFNKTIIFNKIIMNYTVSELSNSIKNTLSKSIPDKLIVTGEISNYKVSNGNMFFTLKDNDSSISVVSWNHEKYFSSDYSNGDKVKVHGKLSCYAKNGTYSLHIYKIEKEGLGKLHLSYEQIKTSYKDKGYFDNKKQFPSKVDNIGIITSPEGAAIQDILFVLNKNNYNGKVYIKRCAVQGNQCAKTISDSIEYFNTCDKQIDLILVTRGGGSFEDLMGYSDPKVIESIYKSKIFVMSAVGHEIDFMLSDFVADIRAPTPSIGAEIISQKYNEVINNLNTIEQYIETTLKRQINNSLNKYLTKLDLLNAVNISPLEKLNYKLNSIEQIENNLNNFMNSVFNKYNTILDNIDNNITTNNINNNNLKLYIKHKNRYKQFNNLDELYKLNNLDLTQNTQIKIKLPDGKMLLTVKKVDIKKLKQ